MAEIGMLDTKVEFAHRRQYFPGTESYPDKTSVDYLHINVYNGTDTGHILTVTINGVTSGDIDDLIAELYEVQNKLRLSGA